MSAKKLKRKRPNAKQRLKELAKLKKIVGKNLDTTNASLEDLKQVLNPDA